MPCDAYELFYKAFRRCDACSSQHQAGLLGVRSHKDRQSYPYCSTVTGSQGSRDPGILDKLLRFSAPECSNDKVGGALAPSILLIVVQTVYLHNNVFVRSPVFEGTGHQKGARAIRGALSRAPNSASHEAHDENEAHEDYRPARRGLFLSSDIKSQGPCLLCGY